MRAVSLFTGVGGLDLGFEAAGYSTAVALEIDKVCCSTLRANRSWPLIEGDIHQVSSSTLLDISGLAPGEADVLIGGPPCQPFSKSGYWANGDAKRLQDKRADTLGAYLRVLRDIRPRALLLENVTGLAFKGKDEGLGAILAGIEAINAETGTKYRPAVQVVNAADYGVPQLRERVLVVASRDGRPFNFPTPTFGDPCKLKQGQRPWRTSWDALGDLPPVPSEEDLRVGGKWAALLPSIPEGQNYLWHTRRGGGLPLFGWRTRYWNFLLKLAKDKPSWTVQAQPGSATGPFHWASRKLSARELARLQTFPDDVVFPASRNEIQRMLGNAVPSLLAEVVAREIAVQLLGSSPYPGEPTLLPPDRGPAPLPERMNRVPEQYLALVDDYEDHPGTGLGRRAQLRANFAA